MFKLVSRGLMRATSSPSYGDQDVGVTPGGAMDRFSYWSANIILGNPENSEGLEIIIPPLLEAQEDGYFVLTGAAYKGSYIAREGKKIPVNHSEVYQVKKRDQVVFGQKLYGFRTYLCYRQDVDIKTTEVITGRKRGSFDTIQSWVSPTNRIRVVKGPEYDYLENPEALLDEGWTISNDMSDMGMRLESSKLLRVNMGNMISEAVADGTIQVTAKGPIILLRHRQTVGGYPRCFNVIQADVDRLAQYMPGQILRFSLVSLDEAFTIAKQMNNDLVQLRKKYKSLGVK